MRRCQHGRASAGDDPVKLRQPRHFPTLYGVVGLALAIGACGCSTEVELPAAGGAELDPIVFFTGPSHGVGELDKLFGSSAKVAVESIGRRRGEALVLDQAIREGDKPLRVRRWTMRPVAPNRYSGTLTDASGPVHVTLSGPRAYIRYTMKNGFNVHQQLALQSDGRTLLNRLQVEKFGIRVATLEETIRKVD